MRSQTDESKLTETMPETAENFLASWTDAYLSADPRDRGKLEEAVALCFEDADREGITREALTDAAGGDVGAHLTRSLTR